MFSFTMKFVVVLLLISVFIASASAYSHNSSNGRIIGGSDAKRRQFTYMVSVQLDGWLWCGGTVIAKTWVVSAAHCYEIPETQNNLTAVAGLLDFGENHPDVQSIPVTDVFNHPEYTHIIEGFLDNDISLLKLAEPLKFTEAVQPARLPESEPILFEKAWLSGWGIYHLPSTEPTTLQCLEMPVITNKECAELFTKVPQPYKLLDSMVCTKPPIKDESGCFGDSGGPLAQNGVLIGITSWSSLICGLEHGPTVFTRVSWYIDFINAHITD